MDCAAGPAPRPRPAGAVPRGGPGDVCGGDPVNPARVWESAGSR